MVCFLSYAALTAVAAAGVQAVNQAPPVPQNAQIGELNFDVTCALVYALNYTFNAVFTATAPVSYGAGQEIYYTDVVGIITVPAAIIDLAPLIGAKYATAQADIELELTNASPATFTAFDGLLTNITVPTTGDAIIRIPSGSGTLPPIGPITLGQADVAHRIFLGQVDITVTLQDANYSNIIPIPVTCGKQDVNFVIASINVDDSTGAPFAPANGFVPDFPPTAPLYESGSFRFPYACDFGPLGPQTVDLVIGGTIPTYFHPGQSFSLTQSQSFLYVPNSLITLAGQAYPNATTLAIDVTEFEVTWENATPESYNVASNTISTSVSIVGEAGNSNFNIPIPTDGYLTVGPFAAGADGTYAAIALGHSVFSASLEDSEGNTLFTFDGTCDPSAPLELIAIPITTATPPEYFYGINTASSSTSSATGSSTSSAGISLPSLLRV